MKKKQQPMATTPSTAQRTKKGTFPANPSKQYDPDVLKRLFETHGSAYAIAKRLGCTAEHVRRQLRALGLPLLKPGEHTLMTLDDSVSAWDHGVVAVWLRTHPGIRLPRSVGE